MRKVNICSIIIFSICLLSSCNADILMNNGEIRIPDSSGNSSDNGGGSGPDPVELTAPTGINATKSYFSDSIRISWSAVNGADYYTIEKTAHDSEALTGLETWQQIQSSVNGTNFLDDSSELSANTYYSYRITAHTYEGISSPASATATGTILASPNTITATQGSSETGITVEWTQMPYVNSYIVYKSANGTITGADSERVAVVGSTGSGSISYTYSIDQDREAGDELTFAVQSVGETGERAALSNTAIGYTLIPGAPVKPEITSITKGSSTNSITIKFVSSVSDVDFVIRKSYTGGSEEVVVDTSLDQWNKLTQISDNTYQFVDTSVIRNVEYRYSVTTKNEIGLSEAATSTAYLLSPVSNVVLTAVNSETQFGYILTYKLPVGADDEERKLSNPYKYVITQTLKDESSSETIYEESVIDQYTTIYYEFDKDITKAEELKELRSISITVETDNLSSSSVTSNLVPFIPDPITSISATSNNKPAENDQPNRYNVYPVHVKWETDSEDSSFMLYRMDEDGNTVSFQASGREYTDETTQPLILYEYWIDATDDLGRTYGEPHAEDAYGSITLEAYKVMFESLSLKPWDVQDYVPDAYKTWWRNTDIAKMIEYGNSSNVNTQMKALGEASASDHYHDGSRVYYNAYREYLTEVGAHIVFEYTNFGENANWTMNGQYRMDVTGTEGNGSASSSTNGFDVAGMYPGHFDLGTIVVRSKGFSGKYYVKYEYSDGTTQEGYVEA